MNARKCPHGDTSRAMICEICAHEDTEDRIASNFMLGQVVAQESIGPKLRERSGKAFAEGRDDEARILRELARDFELQADRARREYKKRYPNS